MRPNCLIFLVLIFVAGANAQTTLIATGSSWRYLADGTDPGVAWSDPAFDDSSWSNGVAKLGFGGAGVATLIGDGTNEHTAFYFRKTFNVPDVTLFSTVLMRMIVDDGAVVYLNGVEVLRHNLPAGSIDFQTLALADVTGAAETNFTTNAISSAMLVSGANILAAEVHQSATNSPDLGWEFDLVGVLSAPLSITEHPTNQVVREGQPATFTVVATGGVALSYQWQKDGVSIAGATNSTLTLSNVSLADGGGYSCIVSNADDFVTSQVAILTVNADPACAGITISQQPTNTLAAACVGVCFSVMATGTNCAGTNALVTYQWQRNDGLGFADIPGANGATFCTPVTLSDNGVPFRVVVSVPGATAASQSATLTVLADLTPPLLVSASPNCTNNTVTVDFSELMNPEPAQNMASYSIPGVLITMAKLNADGKSVTLGTDSLLPNTTYTLTVNGLTDLCGGNLIAPNPSQISFQCTTAPMITIPPLSQTVAPGSSATFTVQASGPPPLRYVWFKDSSFIAGATNSTLTISNAQVSDVGRYSVRVSGTNGTVTSLAAELAVLDSYSLDLPAGYSLIAIQLYESNNLISTVIPVVPDGTILLKWDAAAQSFTQPDTYVAGFGWLPSTTTLSPGEGAIINLSSPQTLLFAGAFRPPTLPINLSSGYNLVGRQIPRPGNFEQITGQSPVEGTIVDQYRPATDDYRTHVYLDGQWRDHLPVAQVGEAVWISQIARPIITGQPAPQTNAIPGSTINFAVEVSGTPPFRFQWQRNGVSIPDATNASYSITNAQILDSGIYTVAVQPSRLVLPPTQLGGEEDLPGAVISAGAALQFITAGFPFSDDFGARPVVATFAAPLTGNNSAAGLEPGEPRHAGKPGGRSVWLAWMAPANGIVTFTTLGSSFDTVLAAYAANGFPGAEVASDDDGAPFLNSRITFNATAGQLYNIAVDGFGGVSGNFVLSWNLEETTERLPTILTPPQNQVASLNGTARFTVAAAGANLTYQWFLDGQAVSGATSNSLTINSVRDSDVGVYVVQINSDARFVLSQPVQLQIGAAGADQLRAVDKFQEIVFAATNDAVQAFRGNAVRKAVTHGFSGTQIFSSVGSTKDAGEPNHCGVRGGKSEWFTYQPTNNGTLKVDTDGSNFDTVLAIYVGPGDSFLTLTNVACDNNSGTNGKTSAVLFNVTSNTIYYIAVDGVNNPVNGVAYSGSIHLNYRLVLPLVLTSLSYSPSNDNGRVIFKVTGTPDLAATVQSATNLASPTWTSLFTNTAANGSFSYTNTNAVTFSNRFYRAVNKL